jgi:hypothetical protein
MLFSVWNECLVRFIALAVVYPVLFFHPFFPSTPSSIECMLILDNVNLIGGVFVVVVAMAC